MRPRRRPRPSGPSGIVTLLTDFGLDDTYVGTVKGVLLAINPGVRLVDLTHAVPPQDIQRAALLLEAAWRFFPRGTVHLAIVTTGSSGSVSTCRARGVSCWLTRGTIGGRSAERSMGETSSLPWQPTAPVASG